MRVLICYYRPQRSCGKVMFLHLSVILSTGGRGVSSSGPEGGQTPPGRHPPAQCMLGYGQQVDGTDPIGMHSCWTCRSTHVDLFFVWFAHVMGMQHLPTFCLFTQEVIF